MAGAVSSLELREYNSTLIILVRHSVVVISVIRGLAWSKAIPLFLHVCCLLQTLWKYSMQMEILSLLRRVHLFVSTEQLLFQWPAIVLSKGLLNCHHSSTVVFNCRLTNILGRYFSEPNPSLTPSSMSGFSFIQCTAFISSFPVIFYWTHSLKAWYLSVFVTHGHADWRCSDCNHRYCTLTSTTLLTAGRLTFVRWS